MTVCLIHTVWSKSLKHHCYPIHGLVLHNPVINQLSIGLAINQLVCSWSADCVASPDCIHGVHLTCGVQWFSSAHCASAHVLVT